MDRITAMQVFVTVVDLGSQSAAAERLDLSRPAVSRYLAELEAWAGARLMHRTTRKLGLTAAGEEMLPRCRQVLETISDMRTAVAGPPDVPHGLLRISVSSSFGQAQLAQVVADYLRLYPRVTIDLMLLDRAVNLVDERVDLAIRITNELDPNLIAKRLSVCRSVLCASPAYLHEHGTPRSLEDLSQHNCLTHSYHGKSLWHFTRDGEPTTVAVGGNISANETPSLVQAALAGAGVAMLPTFLAMDLVREGRLIALLPEATPRELAIYAVYTSRKHMTAALRTMLDFLASRFPSEPVWDQQG
ncbi:LysR family transcriptional regulator [Pigmentiphaga aceris]|uniref:LysR family transcriptional regulator n=1 Tax=Pigmentiphaga aceris TaxID=1940612 RepID=A0A5C0AV23_9BURK|nr:LysR family transcriptional regulator [Pigmentiphaga aceris]QEI06035.1 LysR family transcriptional regulator [Pigmentiphaga aceris]